MMGCFNEISIEEQNKIKQENNANIAASMCFRRYVVVTRRLAIVAIIFTMAAYIIGYLVGKGGY